MKSIIKKIIFIVLALAVCFAFAACGNTENVDKNNDRPTLVIPEGRQYYDIFIFMGQSNMAGRGLEYDEAIPVGEGHGFEYRAVTGNDKDGWLYPVSEPFGKYENNSALSDGNNGDGKKSGGLVSAFCESYYEETGVPVVGVSASVGGTSINLWTPGTSYFNESKRRLRNALDYVSGLENTEVRYINMVWCQGESDASSFAAGSIDYNAKLKSIYEGLTDIGDGWGVEHCFVIPPSEYSNGSQVDAKVKLIENQIKFCEDEEDFILASLKFRNVPSVLRDDPHFHQGVYNVCGWDAGKNIAGYIETEKEAECTVFSPGEETALAEKFGIELSYHT